MVTNLPLELVEKIWFYLDVSDRVKVQRVCKAWKDYSRASKTLWTNMMYIRKDDAINPDPEKDLTILKQIRSWNDVKIEQMAIVLTKRSPIQYDASVDLLGFIFESGLKDIVLGFDRDKEFQLDYWLALPRKYLHGGINHASSRKKNFNCVNLRSLVVKVHNEALFPFESDARISQTSLEILSISGEEEIYQNSDMKSLPDFILQGEKAENIPFDNMIREARAIDILKCKFFHLSPSIVNLMEQVSSTLEYLTISLTPYFNNGRHESLAISTLHFPHLRFLALKVDSRIPVIRFKTPKLTYLQSLISSNILMFQDLSQLQSIYVKSPFFSLDSIWLSLDPMAKKSLETLYLHSSFFTSKTVEAIFRRKIFPNLRKLVVLPKEFMSTEIFLQNLINIYNGRFSSKKKNKLQTFIWCEFESLINVDEALKWQIIGFIKKNLAENFITVKTKDLLHSYRYSPHIMGNFTSYRNVMEKRKLFFDQNGEPRKNFFVDAPLIENMEDDEFFKNNFTKW